METSKRCANCDWWELEDATGINGKQQAKCLRVLPRADGQGWAVWPITHENHRCWQWAPMGVNDFSLQWAEGEVERLADIEKPLGVVRVRDPAQKQSKISDKR